MVEKRAPVQCTNCGRVYSVRIREGGEFILPTDDGECPCGAESFVELDSGIFDDEDGDQNMVT